jgi:hypothetical protein
MLLLADRPIRLSVKTPRQGACFRRKEFKMKTRSRFTASILLIVAFLVPTWIVYAAPSAASNFRLPADAGWVDSGFVLQAGQPATLSAYGQAITARINVFGPGSVSGPAGQLSICPNYDGAPACAMEYAPYGALVGRIGVDGTPFLIGSGLTFTPESSGALYLAVNDLLPYYADNYGNYMVFLDP